MFVPIAMRALGTSHRDAITAGPPNLSQLCPPSLFPRFSRFAVWFRVRRSCGDSLCYDCCKQWIAFPQLFGASAGSVRVCAVCFSFLSACVSAAAQQQQTAAAASAPAAAAAVTVVAPAPAVVAVEPIRKDESAEASARRLRILRATERRVRAAAEAEAAAAAARAAGSTKEPIINDMRLAL
jgi:hypothetical protein